MKYTIPIVCILLCISISLGSIALLDIMEYWLTDDKIVDYNNDGIVNLKDFALIGSYGSDEYGIDTYGN